MEKLHLERMGLHLDRCEAHGGWFDEGEFEHTRTVERSRPDPAASGGGEGVFRIAEELGCAAADILSCLVDL